MLAGNMVCNADAAHNNTRGALYKLSVLLESKHEMQHNMCSLLVGIEQQIPGPRRR